jgi:hypothetical protein
MDCEYRNKDKSCQIYDEVCENPEKENPDNYNFFDYIPCICGCFSLKE